MTVQNNDLNTNLTALSISIDNTSNGDFSPKDPFNNSIRRASVSSSGVEGNGESLFPSISGNGRFVAFQSQATNLAPNSTNNRDIVVKDLKTGNVRIVSVDSNGKPGNSFSGKPSISHDGRFVAFFSSANNLVPKDTNNSLDIFLHDTQTGKTSLVSVNSEGEQANGFSNTPSISANGRFVVFQSNANNLAPGNPNREVSTFVRDTLKGTTSFVAKYTLNNSISSDGRYVAFSSYYNNIVPNDTNYSTDIFVKDMITGRIKRVSVDSKGNQANDTSLRPSISQDGRYVVFESSASNLDGGNTAYFTRNIFVHDLRTATTRRVSVGLNGNLANDGSREAVISGNGRFVSFISNASNLVTGDTNNKADVFVCDLLNGTTNRISADATSNQANKTSFVPSISGNGHVVAFASSATNFVLNDNNSTVDIFAVINPFTNKNNAKFADPFADDFIFSDSDGVMD